jgi:heterokaryon incompatibility protein (HET)
MTSRYQYNNLHSENSFRLLRLHAGKSKSELKCSLLIVDTERPPLPKYDAISYCWNPKFASDSDAESANTLNLVPSFNSQLTVDSKVQLLINSNLPTGPQTNLIDVNITQNGRDALVQLRYKDQDRLLWIDAICIDQENKEECWAQIKLVGKIYAQATRVLVWLGKGDEHTDFGIRYLKSCGRFMRVAPYHPSAPNYLTNPLKLKLLSK